MADSVLQIGEKGSILLFVQFTLAHIGGRRSSGDEFDSLTQFYVRRVSGYVPCEATAFRKEQEFVDWLERKPGRVSPTAVLLDSRGRQMTSERFADWLGTRRDEGARHIVFAIGASDGWTEAVRGRAQLLLSLGPMTLAHALARLVMAEQLYRACTILAGHPYHTGH